MGPEEYSSNISTFFTWNEPLKSLTLHFLLPGSDVSWRPHPGRLLRSSSAACCQQEVARSSSSFLPLSPSASRNLGKGGKLKQSVSLWKALPLISAEANLRGHSVHSPFGLLLEFRSYYLPISKRHVCNISWLLNEQRWPPCSHRMWNWSKLILMMLVTWRQGPVPNLANGGK